MKKIVVSLVSFIIILGLMEICLLYANKSNTEELNIVNKANTLHLNTYIHEEMTEETINEKNSQYDTVNDGSGNIIIMEYFGDLDSVIIPEEINGNKVVEIYSGAFNTSSNLEMIKIPRTIASNINKIDKFRINEELSNNEYQIYTTTREYNEEYLRYIKLSDEEKLKWEVIPEKFLILFEEVYSNNEIKDFATATDTIPAKYDLREHITGGIPVDNQGSYGICYAYAFTKSAQTYLMLNKNIREDLSEVYAAVKSKQGYGGMFKTIYNKLSEGGVRNSRRKIWYIITTIICNHK